MKYVYIFLLIVVAIFVALFASQNIGEVTVSFFTWSAAGSLALVLIITFTLGLLMGFFIILPGVIGGSFKHLATRLKLKTMEKKSDKAAVKADKVAAEAEHAAEIAAPKAEKSE
jgi:uncharacterized integral membrane protein